MQDVRNNIHQVVWFKTGECNYLGGTQKGVLYVLDLENNRKDLSSVTLFGNGAIHRQNLDDLSSEDWSTLQAEYEKIMTPVTTSGYANGRVYKQNQSKNIGPRKKVWRLF